MKKNRNKQRENDSPTVPCLHFPVGCDKGVAIFTILQLQDSWSVPYLEKTRRSPNVSCTLQIQKQCFAPGAWKGVWRWQEHRDAPCVQQGHGRCIDDSLEGRWEERMR